MSGIAPDRAFTLSYAYLQPSDIRFADHSIPCYRLDQLLVERERFELPFDVMRIAIMLSPHICRAVETTRRFTLSYENSPYKELKQ